MPDGLEEPSPPPPASREEDLPGYCSRSCHLQLPRRLLVVAFLLLLVITPAEGCLPSWFKKERSAPAVLEGSSIVRASSLNALYSKTERIKGTKYEDPEPVDEQVEYVEESEEEESELAGPYGTASPIAYDPLIEEYRRAYIERECKDWCYSGGNCTVEVHPKTYAYVTKECICPPGYTGKRCEEHYIKTLYSSVQGDVESSRPTTDDSYELSISLASGGRASRFQMQLTISAVPALAFFFIIVIIAVGLATYSYRKLTRRKVVPDSTWRSSSTTRTAATATSESINSPDYYLRRTGGVYNTRSPFSPKTSPPPGFEVNGNVLSPLLKFNGQTTLPQTTLGAHSSSFPPPAANKKNQSTPPPK